MGPPPVGGIGPNGGSVGGRAATSDNSLTTSGFRCAWFSLYSHGRSSPMHGLHGPAWTCVDRLRRSSKSLRIERATTPTTTPTRATSPELHRSSWKSECPIFPAVRVVMNLCEPSKGSSLIAPPRVADLIPHRTKPLSFDGRLRPAMCAAARERVFINGAMRRRITHSLLPPCQLGAGAARQCPG